jgi:ACS family sodium-dependent inorganic phosphate cotransporter
MIAHKHAPPPGRWKRHHLLVATCCVTMFLAYIDRVNISVAALSMQKELGWSESDKGLVLSAFFLGYLLMQPAGGWLAHRIGGARVLMLGLVGWSIATLLTPAAAAMSLPFLIAVRIALGLFEGPLHPAAYQLFARWVPTTEQSRSSALYSSSGFLGTLVALPLTGWIVVQYGWPMAFVSFGAGSLLIAVLIWIFRASLLHGHAVASTAHISDVESAPIPWAALLRRVPFWGLVFSFFCTNWVFYVLLLWMPSYFEHRFELDILSTGLYSVLPWAVMFVAINAAGWLSDWLMQGRISRTACRRVLTVSGLGGTAAALFALKYVDTATGGLLVLCVVLAFVAVSYASLAPNVFDLAPGFAGILFSIMNTFGSLPGVVGVAATGYIVEATGSYDGVFQAAGALALAGAAIYGMTGTGSKLVE